MKKIDIKKIVKDKYQQIAKSASSCGCSCGCNSAKHIAKNIGYSDIDLRIAGNANLGLGCGNPVAFSKIKEGDIVLDLGCGAGIDAILAAQKVGDKGKVIGVDMTEEMVSKAKENAKNQGTKNVEFVLGEIENLPLKNDSVDIVITNCVINLTPDKQRAFVEAYRVLKPGGKIYLSDIVLLGDLSQEQRNDKDLISGCVGGALLKDDYLRKIEKAGFKVRVLSTDKDISKRQYQNIPLESLNIEAKK